MSANSVYRNHLFGAGGMFGENRQRTLDRVTEMFYLRQLTELSANRFKWEGMPESVNIRNLELTLLRNALAVFYFDKDIGKFLALSAAPAGNPNFNNDPVEFQIYAPSMVSKRMSANDCVPIWANYTRIPDTDAIQIYARRLARLDRTIEINTDNMRHTRVLEVDGKVDLSMINMSREIDSGTPVIQLKAGLQDRVSVLDLGIDPKSVEALSIERARTFNNAMTALGISNSNQDKVERMTNDEVNANAEQVANAKYVALNERRAAARKINKMFKGLNVTVNYSTDNDAQINTESSGLETFTDEEIWKLLYGPDSSVVDEEWRNADA